ncbi:MAG: hypothetical protein J5J06_03840 [Phycisphaerae bacterium]|nr:hypothetical protein [Phycisphaerae bacterium]
MLHLSGKSVLGFIVVFGIVIWAKFSQQADMNKQMLSQMQSVISQLDSYSGDPEFFDNVLRSEHDKAFAADCDLGGRYRGPSCNEQKYITDVLAGMRNACQRARKDAAVLEFKALEQVMLEESSSSS